MNNPRPSSARPEPSPAQRAEEFALLVERATDYAIFLLDAQGRVATWNEGARRILGYEEAEVLGQTTDLFFRPEDVEAGVPQHMLDMAREHGRVDNERWQKRKDGRLFYARGVDQALTDSAGKVRGYSVIFRDKTRQKQMEETVRASEERFRSIVENITDYAIFTLDARGNISTWNHGAQRILGYDQDEILGQPALVIFTPEDVARGEAQNELEQARREGRAEDERWHVRKDGSRFWGSGVLMRMESGEEQRFIKVLRDMTVSRQAHLERQAFERESTILQERTRLSQELHDTLAQAFTAIQLQLGAAQDTLHTSPSEAEARIVRAIQVAQQSLQETRRVVRALRVGALEHGSLTTAIQKLVEQTTPVPGVRIHWHTEGAAFPLPENLESDLFRIAQEALTNALRHAHAHNIDMALEYTPKHLNLRITDDGEGMVMHVRPAGLGLQGMRERAENIAAEFSVLSAPGQGTQILVVVPVEPHILRPL